jgi:ADP-ribosylation factor related protein 1
LYISGKTTCLERLKHLYSGSSDPREMKIPPTVGLNIGKLEIQQNQFIIWDLVRRSYKKKNQL